MLRFADGATAADDGPQDGVFDAFRPLQDDLGLVNNNGWSSLRTAFEFDLRALPPGATINSASLDVHLNNFEGTRQIALNGYARDGTLYLSDFALGGLVGAGTVGPTPAVLSFSVTSILSQLQSSGAAFAGFNFREDPANEFNFTVMSLNIAGHDAPELSVDYSLVPEPTGLAILGLGVVLLLGWRQGPHAVGLEAGQVFQRVSEPSS